MRKNYSPEFNTPPKKILHQFFFLNVGNTCSMKREENRKL